MMNISDEINDNDNNNVDTDAGADADADADRCWRVNISWTRRQMATNGEPIGENKQFC